MSMCPFCRGMATVFVLYLRTRTTPAKLYCRRCNREWWEGQ